jgi:hypothetical protein
LTLSGGLTESGNIALQASVGGQASVSPIGLFGGFGLMFSTLANTPADFTGASVSLGVAGGEGGGVGVSGTIGRNAQGRVIDQVCIMGGATFEGLPFEVNTGVSVTTTQWEINFPLWWESAMAFLQNPVGPNWKPIERPYFP